MLHFLSCASFTASSSLAFSSWPALGESLVVLDAAAGGLFFVFGAAVTVLCAAAGLASFFTAICLTVTFGVGLTLAAFFGAKGTADFDVGEAATTFGLGETAWALAGTALALAGATLTLAGATLALVTVALAETALVLTGATLALAGATLVLVTVALAGATLALAGAPLVLTTAAVDFTGVAAGLACESFAAGCLIPSASLEAAVLFCCTVSILARVFWIISGLCAQAMPAASVQTRMPIVRFIVSPLFLRRLSRLGRRTGRIKVMTEICGREARGHHALVGRILVRLFGFSIPRLAGRRHQQVVHVHDALQLAHPVEKSEHRVVRTIELDFERHFRVILLRTDRPGCVAADFDARLAGFAAHHAHEVVHFLLVRHDAALDLELLLQASELTLDVGQLGFVGFQLRVLAHFGLQLSLGRCVFVTLGFEDGVIERSGADDSSQHQRAHKLHT